MAPSIAEIEDESSGYYGKLQTTVNDKINLENVIRSKQLVPLWNTGGPPTALEPHSKHIPAVWKYDDMKSLLLRAADLVDAREAERRAVLMINPGYTAISGKKMYMKPGDLIITPVWNWHDHGNEGTDNVIWLDVEEYGVETHESKTASDSEAAGMKFPWKDMEAALCAQGGDYAIQQYYLPDGRPVSTTIGAYALRVAAGKASAPVQETAGNIFQVHAGSGYVEK
ncbi:MAG: hypothetical protein STHCBS139747_005336 [Sporothrix thermara]